MCIYMYYNNPRVSVLWTYSLARWAWRTIIACCALLNTTRTTDLHQSIFRCKYFGTTYIWHWQRWEHCSKICHDFIRKVSFNSKLDVELLDWPAKSLTSMQGLCFVVIAIISVPWDLVFLLDLWLLDPHEDPRKRQ